MRRQVELKTLIEVEQVSHQRIISVDFSKVRIEELCLSMCLLKEGLIDTLILSGEKFLKIRLVENIIRSDKAHVSISGDNISLAVHTEEFDYWLSFFLKYYRDGFADVDHIDVEVMDPGDPQDTGIIFMVKDFVPPVSPAEARRLIDRND